jgi:hypothetical protein
MPSKKPFFSKANLKRVKETVFGLIPFEVKLKPIKEDVDIFQVNGIGFLEDFIVYSRIPAKHWHNASPGQRQITTANPIVMQNLMYGMMSGTSISTGGTTNSILGGTIYISTGNSSMIATDASLFNNVPTIGIASEISNPEEPQLNELIAVPEATQAIEAGVLPEHALITPKAVVGELQRMPTPFNLLDMEKKIKLYRSLGGLVRNGGNGGITNTIKDVAIRLEARLKYRNNKEIRSFFDQFQNTNDDRVQELLEKYAHLRIGPADDFIPEMPDDALEIMTEYAKFTHKVTEKKPVFYLIAKAEDFKRKSEVRGKRDPILLVQSPFGFYWQILGAWDEEMRLLEEI